MRKKVSFLLVIVVVAVIGILAFGVSRVYSPHADVVSGIETSTPPAGVLQEGITVDAPRPDTLVQFPLTIRGSVNGGGWIAFEGYAGSARVLDANGNEVVPQTPLMATTEWTQLPVSFGGVLGSATTTATTVAGVIVIQSENPKGDSGRKEFRIPVRFQ